MGCFIDSYDECVRLFKTVRNPVLGKPVNGKNIRLWQDRDLSFRITCNNHTFAVIKPDGTITFPLSAEKMYHTVASSLIYTMGRFLPFNLYRISTGRYRLGSTHRCSQIKELPEYFGGIQFNFETGECLNRKPDRKHRLIKPAHKVWTSTLKEYRKGLFVRLKLGVRGELTNNYINLNATELAQWMRDKVYPEALFNYLCRYSNNPSALEFVTLEREFEAMIGFHRDALRKEFGVFGDDDAA